MAKARKWDQAGFWDGYYHRVCANCGEDMPSTSQYEGSTTCSPSCAAEVSAAAKFGVNTSKTVRVRAEKLAQIKAKNARRRK